MITPHVERAVSCPRLARLNESWRQHEPGAPAINAWTSATKIQ
jgi:hypothetical protein